MKQIGGKDTPKTANQLRSEKRNLEKTLATLEDTVRITRQNKPKPTNTIDIKTIKERIEEINLQLQVKQTEKRMIRTPTKNDKKTAKTGDKEFFESTADITRQSESIQREQAMQAETVTTIPPVSSETTELTTTTQTQNVFQDLPFQGVQDEPLGASAMPTLQANKTFDLTTPFASTMSTFNENTLTKYKLPGKNIFGDTITTEGIGKNIFGEPLTMKETGTKRKTTNPTSSFNKQQSFFEEPQQQHFSQNLREEFERYKEDQKSRNEIYEKKIRQLYEENRRLKQRTSKPNVEPTLQQETDPYITALQTVMGMIREKQLNATQKNEIMNHLLEEGAYDQQIDDRRESIEIFQPSWAQNVRPVSPIPQLNVTQTYEPNPLLNRTARNTEQIPQLDRTIHEGEPRTQVQRQTVARESYSRRLKHIPIFDGESYKDLRNFLDIAKALDEQWTNEAEKNELIDTLNLNLRSEARDVVGDLYETTFDEMKDKLLKHFSYLANKEVVTSQLENLRQGKNETINEYAERSRKLLKDKCSTYKFLSGEQKKEYDRTARKSFAKGLKDSNVRERLITRGAISLEDAIAYSIELDYDAENIIPNSELFCKYCKMSGHRERDCRRKEGNSTGINALISMLKNNNPNARNFVNFRGPRQNRNWNNSNRNNYNNYNNANNNWNNGNGYRNNQRNNRNWNNGNNNYKRKL